jgi:hypothetical protein
VVKAIRPLLDIVIEAHKRNLTVGDTLGLKNPWIDASREKIISSLRLLPETYQDLSFDALHLYLQMHNRFRQISLVQREAFPEDLTTSMLNIIELSKGYSQVVVVFNGQAVTKAVECGIPFSQFQNDMIRFVISYTDSLDYLLARGDRDRQRAEDLFQQTGDIKIEDVLAILEDNIYFFNENMKTFLERAYRTEKSFPSPTPLGSWIDIRLVRLDPNVYREQLNIPVEEMTVPLDSTWWCSINYENGWTHPAFQMKGWVRHRETLNWDANSNRSQSPNTTTVTQPLDSVFVRKEINIPGYPVSGEAQFSSNPPDRVVLNGWTVSDTIQSIPLELKSFLKEGKNLLAMRWTKKDSFSIESEVIIHYIPERVIPKTGGKEE